VAGNFSPHTYPAYTAVWWGKLIQWYIPVSQKHDASTVDQICDETITSKYQESLIRPIHPIPKRSPRHTLTHFWFYPLPICPIWWAGPLLLLLLLLSLTPVASVGGWTFTALRSCRYWSGRLEAAAWH
jgi:hypothetical protein